MSTSPSTVYSQVDGGTDQQPQLQTPRLSRGGFFSRIGAGIGQVLRSPDLQHALNQLAAAGGNYGPLEMEHQQRELDLRSQLNQAQVEAENARTAQLRQQTEQEARSYQPPQDIEAQKLREYRAQLTAQRELGPGQVVTTPTGNGEFQYARVQGTHATPITQTTQVLNPDYDQYMKIQRGEVAPPNLVQDWNLPPTMPKTIPQEQPLLATPKGVTKGTAVRMQDGSWGIPVFDAQQRIIRYEREDGTPVAALPVTSTVTSNKILQTPSGPVNVPETSTTTRTKGGPSPKGGGQPPQIFPPIPPRSGAAAPIIDANGNPLPPQQTAATRTMAEAAPHVLEFVNRIRPLIEKEAGNMGPLSGRFSDFWTGKVGAPNADYNRLRVDDGLLSTLLMRMHTGSRGAVQLQQHFKDLLGLAHQSPQNYLAALDEIAAYANDLQKGSTPPAPGQPKVLREGVDF